MVEITASVGRNGINKRQDVIKIKQLINKNAHLLVPLESLQETDALDEPTIDAIETFQQRVVLIKPDGRVDPHGQTLKKLNENATPSHTARPQLIFPLRARPTASYKTGGRQFGAQRNGRKHAACDLLAEPETEILAMEDGKVVRDIYPFYAGTFALEVQHKGLLVRYGEIKRTAAGIHLGSMVSKGQVIAYVGQLHSGSSMLHLEMYSGTAQGPLTTNLAPYTRRADLLNPTDYLDLAVLWNATEPLPVGMGRVNQRVSSSVSLRSAPSTAATPPLAQLQPGTLCEVLRAVAGTPYDPGQRTDWYEVQYQDMHGFIAAYYIDYQPGPSMAPDQHQEHDWYKMTQCSHEQKVYLVCMADETPLCKVPLDQTMQDLRSRIDELLQQHVRALTWVSETAMDLTRVPLYAAYYQQDVSAPPPPLDSDTEVMARTLYGEARGESDQGKTAVGWVIMNRVAFAQARGTYWWGNTIRNVCLKPFQFSCWNLNDPNRRIIETVRPGDPIFDRCLEIAQQVIAGRLPSPVDGATHYYAQYINRPAWVPGATFVTQIGVHKFYKDVR